MLHDPAILLCAALVHSSLRSLLPGLLWCTASGFSKISACLGEPRALIPLNQPGAPGLPLGVGLCSDSSWFCSVETGKDKEQCAPNCFYRASHRGHTRGWADSLQKLTPASAQMPGKGSDPWLPCHLRKSAGHWKQTINPGTSQMRSRWLPGTRFPNIPSSPFTLSPMWFPFEGV